MTIRSQIIIISAESRCNRTALALDQDSRLHFRIRPQRRCRSCALAGDDRTRKCHLGTNAQARRLPRNTYAPIPTRIESISNVPLP